MLKDKLEYILDLANECKNHVENACDPKISELIVTTFIQQAFYCAKQLEQIYYSDCKISELMTFYKHFYSLNESLLLKTGLVNEDVKTFGDLYYELKEVLTNKLKEPNISFK